MGAAPVRTLFIANRGEIAARIARTASALGATVVRPATEGPDALDLLDADAVVAAAVAAGAGALHPGYGFLSENADFADAVEAAGIRWVGPPGSAIRAMGDKAAARQLARRIGVPVLPGYDGDDQSDAGLSAAAERIGFPILVKPSAGGGGKGMRLVHSGAELGEALAAARRAARGAFGDSRLILERALVGPRHVEVQVLFDRLGAGVHLGERDCSMQRRHQKVLEESPSPAVTRSIRADLGAAALRLAGEVGYASAGTCEFLLEDDGRFWFLEMNTRLQVEHPVTELVTGRDLVADQLRIAAGEPLGFTQDDVRFDGHAIEVRLYAEDAEAGFLPATGRIAALRWPEGDGIRVDAGVAVGDEVGGRFDPMLAKIVAHGPSRAAALERLATALDETQVLGLVTNLRFLRWVVRQPTVLEGDVRIDWLERAWAEADLPAATLDDAPLRSVVPALVDLADAWGGAWRLNAPGAVRVEVDGRAAVVPPGVSGSAPPPFVRVDDALLVDVEGRSVEVRLAPPPEVERAARAAAAHGAGAGSSVVVAPMPGRVLTVHRAPGSPVEQGDPLITLEAMKMEHVVSAPHGGVVADVSVAPGDQVRRDEPLARIDKAATVP